MTKSKTISLILELSGKKDGTTLHPTGQTLFDFLNDHSATYLTKTLNVLKQLK